MTNFLKSRMVKFCIAELILAIIVISAYFYYKDYKANLVPYEPFAITANGLTLNAIPAAPIMEGMAEGDLMIAAPEGSKIFAKGGLNYVVANATGMDEIYYSLCSTKIIDGKVNVVENFNPSQDKLIIFCGHHEIKPEEIKIIHTEFQNIPITYVHVVGQHQDTAIALLGNIDIKSEDIILNQRWDATSTIVK